jgi:hypothetical protein
VQSGPVEFGPYGTSLFSYMDLKGYGGNSDYDVRLRVDSPWSGTGGSGDGIFDPGEGNFTIASKKCIISKDMTITNGNLNVLYVNNNKLYNIRGYTTKASSVVSYSYLLSSNQTTYTTSSLELPIDTGCFSIGIIYTYYTQAGANYQGYTPYSVLRYGTAGWITNGGTIANTLGSFNFQPLFNVSTDNTTLTIYHTAPTSNGDYVYFTYRIEMY